MINNNSFSKLGLNSKLCLILEKLNYKFPFSIQEKCIPEILNNFDILGISNTGSGKTAAFILPFLNKINKNLNKTQVLILEPTRELVIQVYKVTISFIKYLKWISILPIYGGQKFNIQLNYLKNVQHMIICTPGRLIEHINKKTIKLNDISGLVIDEADEMFKMGFIKDVEKIINNIPKNRQTLLFSATMPNSLKIICYKFIRNNFKEILVKDLNENNNLNINQYYILSNNKFEKKDNLIKFLFDKKFNSIIIFSNTKNMTIEIFNFLKKYKFNVLYINSDIKQYNRDKTIDLFRKNKFNILIATDVISRGFDISKLDWVINFDFPINKDIYIHRIGRTGRAGNKGNSLSLLNNNELKILKNYFDKNIELKNINIDKNKFEKIKLENLLKFIVNINKDEKYLEKYSYFCNKILSLYKDNINLIIKILIDIIISNNFNK